MQPPSDGIGKDVAFVVAVILLAVLSVALIVLLLVPRL